MQYQYQSVVIMERGWQPATSAEISSPNCPRCGSSNTKFCYYNNYSLTQPRYFCKSCRRYWTKGGNLRNVPVGGGCRKNRRAAKSLRLSTQLLSHSPTYRNNNSRTAAPDNDPLGRYSAARDSSSGHPDSDSGSHIDLALVYANFLNNPQPESNKVKSSEALEDNSIIPSPSPNNIQMLEGSNNNSSIGFFGWDSLSDLFADSDHLKVADSGFESRDIISNGQIYNHGGVLHNNHHAPTTTTPDNNTAGYDFELPPLPGEGVGSTREITMAAVVTWPDSGHQLLEDHHSLAVTELLPIINGAADDQLGATADHDLNLIGSSCSSKEFDFDGDNTFLRK